MGRYTQTVRFASTIERPLEATAANGDTHIEHAEQVIVGLDVTHKGEPFEITAAEQERLFRETRNEMLPGKLKESTTIPRQP